MPYTVTRKAGHAGDAGFDNYVRLLLKRKLDIGRAPRVPEPEAGRRWVYAWDAEVPAAEFAGELIEETGDDSWEVRHVDGPADRGPLGPVVIQVGRRAKGLALGLHAAGRAVIRSAFPEAKPPAATAVINFESPGDLRAAHGEIDELVRQIAPSLTGLSLETLDCLEYVLAEEHTDRTLLAVPPGDLKPHERV